MSACGKMSRGTRRPHGGAGEDGYGLARLVGLTDLCFAYFSLAGGLFGLGRRHAYGIIIPLIYKEARNGKNPSGGTIFLSELPSSWEGED